MDPTVGELAWLSLQTYGLAIVISLAVALLIKVIVIALSVSARRQSAAKAAAAPAKPVARAPAAAPEAHAGPPEADIAAITAAVYAIVGPHRIVRIQEAAGQQAWTAEGRILHQTSHQPHRRQH